MDDAPPAMNKHSQSKSTVPIMSPDFFHNRILRQFALYDDFRAGQQARRLAKILWRTFSSETEFCLEMWKGDMVSKLVRVQDVALEGAAEAEVLILSLSEAQVPEPWLYQWFERLTPWRLRFTGGGILIALLGLSPTNELEPGCEPEPGLETIAHLSQFARRVGMRFAWQPMCDETPEDFSWALKSLSAISQPNTIQNCISPAFSS